MRSGLANTTALAAFIIFGAVLVPSLILGPSFHRDISAAQRLANGLQFVPVYLLALATFMASFGRSYPDLYRHKLLIAWGMYGFLSLFWAADPQATVLEVVSLFGTLLAIIAVGANLSFDRFMRMLSTILLVAAVGSIVFIYLIPSWGRMSGDQSMEYSTLIGLPQGVFRHKQQLAKIMTIGIFVALATRGIVSNPRRALLFAASAICLVLSRSATAMMATIVGLGAATIWRATAFAFRSSIGSGIAMLILIIYGGATVAFGREFVLSAFGKDDTFTGRTEVWSHALEMIRQHPIIGYGFGSIWQTPMGVIPGTYIIAAHSHNLWLELMLMGGLIGTIPIALFLLYILLVSVTGAQPNRNVRLFLLTMAFATLFRSMFEVDFHGNDLAFFLLISALTYFRKEQNVPLLAGPVPIEVPAPLDVPTRARFIRTEAAGPRPGT